MFGYVRTDTPYLYMKDMDLYRAMYCGVCKGIGASSGTLCRMGLSYDVTFLSVLLHNILALDVKIEKQHCLTHCIRVKNMAEVDELTKQLGALNTELVYYKYTDDIEDGDKGRGKRLWFQSGHRRVQKRYPELARIVRENLSKQKAVETNRTASLDIAADATASMLKDLSNYLLGEKKSDATATLFYALGKWIYLIDALDDYDKDKKKGAYNPFLLSFEAESKCELLEKHGEEVGFAFRTLFADIRESLCKIPMAFNRDLVDNVLLRGLPAQTKRVMEGPCKTCKKQK